MRIGTMVAIATLALAAAPGRAAPGREGCEALAGTVIAADRIKLPTRGARIAQARLVEGPGKPAYCMVTGAIAPVDQAAPPILFEVNLPADWNAKLVQLGGGGLNGTLVTGLDPLRDSPGGPTPLEQGYATAGTDGGHPVVRPDIQVFALNEEALLNHAYGAYKKTHDVAVAIVRSYYGRPPRRVYYFGASEGGREALLGAQRFPEDYDGIVSIVPVASWTGVNLSTYHQFLLHEAGGYMDPEKIRLWQATVLAACDAQDGLSDGLIARYRGCDAGPALHRLRCASGRDEGATCYSNAQLAMIDAIRDPYAYGLTLANGERGYPGFGIGSEAAPGNVAPTLIDAPDRRGDALGRPRYTSGDIRFFFVRDPDYVGPLNLARYGPAITRVSAAMDMTDPDLARFQARGGKIIMRSNTSDYVVAPGSVWRYYQAVVDRMGKAKADGFIRLYVSPGTSHGSGGTGADGSPIPSKIDLLAALDRWVETGRPLEQPVLVALDPATKQLRASLPFCRYPDYPRYAGTGDPKAAASYRCTPT